MGIGQDDSENINLSFIQNLLDAGANINQEDVYGQTVFFAIVRDWNCDVAKFALLRGADINYQDDYGRTPLHLAAAVNYKEMVAFLIENGGEFYTEALEHFILLTLGGPSVD